MSRPKLSVPMMPTTPGRLYVVAELIAYGSCVAISGAQTAMTKYATSTIRLIVPNGWERTSFHIRLPHDRPEESVPRSESSAPAISTDMYLERSSSGEGANVRISRNGSVDQARHS